MKRIAIIPARGGSKRLPRKNIRDFFGKPIIAYSIEAAEETGFFDRIYCSTDDPEIAAIAHRYGALHLPRPARLADGKSGTPDVMRYHANQPVFDGVSYLCCIYPTAPLMLASDIKYGFRLLQDRGAAFAFPVGTDPLRDAGQWYWGTRADFAAGTQLFAPDSLMVPIPEERVCDINEERDWLQAQLLFAALRKKAA